ncbi:excalibur calcium-binding domain-containing protein [Pseudomonas sp.]|uniref:excalibur calcium-binding domain-containing protein n=1 Tax=Pseudomonas sp. TaxID=306 RepID=UPI003D0F8841
MKKLLLIVAIGFAVWQYYLKPADSPVITNIASDGSTLTTPVISQPFSKPVAQPFSTPTARAQAAYRCDGRTHCSQMRSCEEATYFLRNCPGTKMDGNHDGVPCEQQWCR